MARQLAGRGAAGGGDAASSAAKEAFYKCQYPLVGQRLDFQDVGIAPLAWGAAQGTFALVPVRPLSVFDRAPGGVHGAYRFHEQFVSAGVCVIAAPSRNYS